MTLCLFFFFSFRKTLSDHCEGCSSTWQSIVKNYSYINTLFVTVFFFFMFCGFYCCLPEATMMRISWRIKLPFYFSKSIPFFSLTLFWVEIIFLRILSSYQIGIPIIGFWGILFLDGNLCNAAKMPYWWDYSLIPNK